tara:strand:+ start:506 stop:949 length:444 start_codon:yes stop_codon:yes gene_type:complete
VWCGAEDHTLGHLRIDNRINAIAEHNDKDVITIAEVNLNDSTVTSLDEEGAGRLAYDCRGRLERKINNNTRREYDEHALISMQIDGLHIASTRGRVFIQGRSLATIVGVEVLEVIPSSNQRVDILEEISLLSGLEQGRAIPRREQLG